MTPRAHSHPLTFPTNHSAPSSSAMEEALLLLNLRNGAMKEFEKYQRMSEEQQISPSDSPTNLRSGKRISRPPAAIPNKTPSPNGTKSTKSRQSPPSKTKKSRSKPTKTSSLKVNTISPPPTLASTTVSPNVAVKLKDFPDPPDGPPPPISICVKPARASDQKYIDALHIPRTLNTAPYKYRVRLNVPKDVFKTRELLFRVRRADNQKIVLFNKRPKRKRSKDGEEDAATDLQPAMNWHLNDFFPIKGGYQLTYQVTFSLCSFHYNKSAFYIELWTRRPGANSSATARHDEIPDDTIVQQDLLERQKMQGDRTEEDKDTDQLELLFRFPAIELLARKRKEQDIWQEREESEEDGAAGTETVLLPPAEGEAVPSAKMVTTLTNTAPTATEDQSSAQSSPDRSINSSFQTTMSNTSSHDDESAQPLKKRRLS